MDALNVLSSCDLSHPVLIFQCRRPCLASQCRRANPAWLGWPRLPPRLKVEDSLPRPALPVFIDLAKLDGLLIADKVEDLAVVVIRHALD